MNFKKAALVDGTFTALLLISILLKLTGTLDVSWGLVLLPLWMHIVVFLVAAVVISKKRNILR